MAKKKEEIKDENVTVVGQDVEVIKQTEFVIPKDAIIDVSVTVISLAGDPYHKDGEEFQMAKRTAIEREKLGWVKIKE